MGTRPKFFCEFCGTEVKQKDRVCPHCGKFFASVKCPSCGFTGDSGIFKEGCPLCGYAVFKGAGKGSGGRANRGKASAFALNANQSKGPDPLPWWIYAAALGLCCVVLALILLRR